MKAVVLNSNAQDIIDAVDESKKSNHVSLKVDLSLRNSLIETYTNNETFKTITQVEIENDKEAHQLPQVLKKGDLVKGYVVKAVPRRGCFIRLARGFEARCLLSNLTDSYLRESDLSKTFPSGRLVSGRVLSVDMKGKKKKKTITAHEASNVIRIELSLKKSDIDANNTTSRSELNNGKRYMFEDIQKALEKNAQSLDLDGIVRRVTSFGVFVDLGGSTGMAHITECAEGFIEDLNAIFSPGDLVRARVLKAEKVKNKGRISLGLKPSYFETISKEDDGEDSSEDSQNSEDLEQSQDAEDSEQCEQELEINMGIEESDDEDADLNFMKNLQKEVEDEIMQSESESESEGEKMQETKTKTKSKKTKEVYKQVGFDFGEDNSDSSDSDEEEEEEEEEEESAQTNSKKKSSRQVAEETERREAKLLAEGSNHATDRSTDDFERLLLTRSNESRLWIEYMEHCVSLTDFDRARRVAERALTQISHREASEKLNIWASFLELEHKYGTEQEVDKLYARALTSNDDLETRLRFIDILIASGPASHTRAEAELKSASKKHGKRRDDGGQRIYERWLRHLYTRTGGDPTITSSSSSSFDGLETKVKASASSLKEVKKVMVLAKDSLKKKAFVAVQCRQAILEFGFGDEERGRTFFESVLGDYPKRMDIWGQYSDQEIKRLRTAIQRREKGLSRYVFACFVLFYFIFLQRTNKYLPLIIHEICRSSRSTMQKEEQMKEKIREVLQRMVSQPLPKKKLKAALERYLRFENDLGDKEGVEKVMEMARTFANK